VQRLNGQIDVRSRPGTGSTFIVTLPIDRQCLNGEKTIFPERREHETDTAG
jgi:hypothetical protein